MRLQEGVGEAELPFVFLRPDDLPVTAHDKDLLLGREGSSPIRIVHGLHRGVLERNAATAHTDPGDEAPLVFLPSGFPAKLTDCRFPDIDTKPEEIDVLLMFEDHRSGDNLSL